MSIKDYEILFRIATGFYTFGTSIVTAGTRHRPSGSMTATEYLICSAGDINHF